jgi:hypothetical protein
MIAAPGGTGRDQNDEKAVKHGREVHSGTLYSNYIQSPPILFTRDGHAVYFGDIYRGSSCFLISGGPSFSKIDKSKLNNPGFITWGINNSVKSFRPNLWTCVDDPTHFMLSIWKDPKIQKIVPFSATNKFIFDNVNWKMTNIKVGECPNVLFYRRNEYFDANKFLFEDTVNWGNHTQIGGGRSVLLATLRLMFFVGIRRVFLLGVDFKMDEQNTYHFDQGRTKASVEGNNATYLKLIERFAELKPVFDKFGFEVYNCNPESNLKVFPFMDYEEAIKKSSFDFDLATERTEGMYDRVAKEKEAQKNNAKEKKASKPISFPPKLLGASTVAANNKINTTFLPNEEEKSRTKKELDAARLKLDLAKVDLENLEKNKTSIPENEYQSKSSSLKLSIARLRAEFKEKERIKNLIWFGTEVAPKK